MAPLRWHLSRRRVLAWFGAPGMAALDSGPMKALAGPVATGTVTVLYRRDGPEASARTGPAALAATLALESEFLRNGLQVVQPNAEIYKQLDRGPTVAVSFAADAGMSMLVSAQTSMRPMPGMDKAVTEVILRGRVFVGHSILAAEEGRGMIATSTEADVRGYAVSRSAQQAAQRAAAALVEKVCIRLKALSAEEVDRLTSLAPVQGAPASASSSPLPAVARKFALVVTVSDYSALRKRLQASSPGMFRPSDPQNLPGVAEDRRNLVAALQSLGFPKENICELADAQASSASMREELGKLVRATRPDDLVVIAVSSHGLAGDEVPSGFGMPVLSDYAPGDHGKLDFWQLQSMVANLPARRTVLVVDTCHAGGATTMMTAVEVSAQGVRVGSALNRPDPARMAEAQGGGARAFAVMAAARPDEVSLEVPGRGGGLFTDALVHGLMAKRSQPLETIFREQVLQQVIERSKQMCGQSHSCSVQTPMFAYSGRGNEITL